MYSCTLDGCAIKKLNVLRLCNKEIELNHYLNSDGSSSQKHVMKNVQFGSQPENTIFIYKR